MHPLLKLLGTGCPNPVHGLAFQPPCKFGKGFVLVVGPLHPLLKLLSTGCPNPVHGLAFHPRCLFGMGSILVVVPVLPMPPYYTVH